MKIPKPIENLIEAFERLPGIGPKSAARLTFYMLRVPEAEREMLGRAVLALGEKVHLCGRCCNIAQAGEELCEVCAESSRDPSTLCVVEEPLDLLSFERMGKYKGLYHVLHGAIAPLEHIGPENLKIDELMTRLKNEPVREVILATNPSLEGEATAMYIKKIINQEPEA
ncbi:MAG: recombination mediator RecR, partial [bacterium]|nr:recombination mediator RecR [bacterium]